jgi:choline dehydrogenase
MGPEGVGVVDQRGRVHGVEDLYVIDASIFPMIPSSPTNLPTIMLAERCAGALREALARPAAGAFHS